jgi:small subunit ribosomal protein S16
MATAIRLKRGGRTHAPYYRMVVTDSRSRARGAELDILGYYHPCARPEPKSEIDITRALEWLRKGAQPSDTAKNVLSQLGVLKHFHDGSTPVEAIAVVKGAVVVDKGYNAPPPPKEEAPAAPVVEEAAEAEAAVEAEAPAETAEAEAPQEEKAE